MKNKKRTEVIIVGSGAGGATLAKELTKQGRKVIVIEKGRRIENLGTIRAGLKFYDRFSLLKSKEGTILYRTIMVGGTTVVSCGNAVRTLQKEFSDLGINLEEEFIETERELNVGLLPEKRIIGGSRKIHEAAEELRYKMEPMPKFVKAIECKSCGNCVLGCQFNAKWTAVDYLEQALENNASKISLITQTEVTGVLISNGKAIGVKGLGPDGPMEIIGNVVILAAGGIGTPIILQKSGLSAGKNFFCDLFNVIYGATEDISQLKGMNMSVVDTEFHDSKGFILSSFVDPSLTFMLGFGWRFLIDKLPRKKTLGIMTKITDESMGRIYSNGRIEKPVTANDNIKLQEGAAISKEILIKAGVKPKSIFVTRPK